MKRYVTSTGGPLIIMEANVYPQWGGVLSNSASKFHTTDYDFACQIDKYISVVELDICKIIVLGDMPMDTSIVQDKSKNDVYIVRLMYGDTNDEELFICYNYDRIFTKKNETDSGSYDNVSFRSSHMILADSSETAAFSLGCKHHLFFDLGAPKCSIRTFDYNTKDIRAIVHALK